MPRAGAMPRQQRATTVTESSRRDFLIAAGASAGVLAMASSGELTAATTAPAAQHPNENRSLDDVFVMDSVVHVYNLSAENSVASARDIPMQLGEMLYQGFLLDLSPRGQPQWIPGREIYFGPPKQNIEYLAHALFAESPVDACVYHGIPLYGIFKDGGSPLWVGKEMRKRWPGRVNLYGPVSPWQPDAIDRMDRMIEEDGIVGIKLYPMDLVDGAIKSYRLDDPTIAYPLIEHARKRGIRNVAFHKAMPLGPVPMDPFRVGDIDNAAIAFPDMKLEIVHGGFAFLEETAWLLARFPNVVINLEGSSGFLCNKPRRFAELLGTFLSVGGADRIYWSVGTMAVHPRPFVEAFWNFQMPKDLVEQYGVPPITSEMKEKILGLNHARDLKLDVGDMRKRCAGDEFSRLLALAAPWSAKI